MSDFSVDMLLDAAAARIESLERDVEEHKRDAERYRWLRDNPETEDIYGRMGAELDAAIDAALAEKGKP